MPAFAQFCGEFLQFQLNRLSPRLVVVMGPNASAAFDSFAKRFCDCRVLYTAHPYADFGMSEERLSTEIDKLAQAWET
jgi:hypothetical protein